MKQKRQLYIILVAVAAVALIGLIILAVSLDGGNSAGGQNPSTGDTSTTDTKSDETTESTQDSTQDTTESTQDTTDATQDTTDSTQDTTEGTETTESTGNTQNQGGSEESKPDDKPVENTDSAKDKWSVTYEEYNAMSGAEQEKFYYSFASADDYFKWYNAAKKAYEDSKNDIVIGGDGSIDLGEILNGKP